MVSATAMTSATTDLTVGSCKPTVASFQESLESNSQDDEELNFCPIVFDDSLSECEKLERIQRIIQSSNNQMELYKDQPDIIGRLKDCCVKNNLSSDQQQCYRNLDKGHA